MTTTGADVAELGGLRVALGHRAWNLARDVRELDHALWRAALASDEFVPRPPPHGARGELLVDRVRDLARRTDRTCEALAAADQWVGWRIGEVAVDAHLAVDSAVVLRHGAALGWSRVRRMALGENAIGPRLERLGAVADDALARRAWRGVGSEVADDLRLLFGPTSAAVDDVARTGSRLRWARDVVATSRLGPVTRLGGKGLAGAGLVLGVRDVVVGYRERDMEQGVTGALSTMASVAAVIPVPPVQVAAAAVTAGLLVYEYRHELAGAGRTLVEGATDLVAGARSALKGLF